MIIGISGKIGSGKDTVGKIIQLITDNPKYDLKKISYLLKNGYGENDFPIRNVWQIKKFAGKLKEIVALLTGCSVKDLENPEFKNKALGSEWDQSAQYNGKECHSCGSNNNTYLMSKNPTYRELLQVVGTEAMRNTIHENVWVNAFFADYKLEYNTPHTLVDPKIFEGEDYEEDFSKSYPKWIITDMRFPNELKAIEDRDGITIRISRNINIVNDETNQVEGMITNWQDKMLRETQSQFNHPSETALDNAVFKYTIDNNGTIEELIEKVKEILITEKIIK